MADKIIKFTGSEDKGGRAFLTRIIKRQEYRYNGEKFPLRTADECDKSLFKDDSELAVFEASRNPDAPAPNYAIAKACVSAEDYLLAQAIIKDVEYEVYKDSGSPEKLERVMEGMKEGHQVPIPVLEFEKNGELHDFQEGRHRARAAIKMGKEYMPVFLAKKVR